MGEMEKVRMKMRKNGKKWWKEETEEKWKNDKGKEENEKCKGKKDYTKAEDFFFFFAFHFTFMNPLKLFLGLPEWKFLPGKG